MLGSSKAHFGRITQAAARRIDRREQEWEPGADFGSIDPGERWWFEPEGNSGRGYKWLHLASILKVEPTGLAVLCEEKRGVLVSSVHMFVLYIYVSISALQTGSSVPFF